MKLSRSFLVFGSILLVVGLAALATIVLSKECDEPVISLAAAVNFATVAADSPVTLVIANPDGHSLFVPADWQGLALYRKRNHGWEEVYYPSLSQVMMPTQEALIKYIVPGAVMSPGRYQIVVEGWLAQQGTPFSLDAEVEIADYCLLDIQLVTPSPLVIRIHNNREQSVTLGRDQGIILKHRSGNGDWEEVRFALAQPAAQDTELAPGDSLEVEISTPLRGDYLITVAGQAADGKKVQGEVQVIVQ